MKYIYEKEDIRVGRYLVRNTCPNLSHNVDSLLSYTVRIGYVGDKGDDRYRLFSVNDGLIFSVNDGTLAGLLEYLNESTGNFKGHRPLTSAEWEKVKEYESTLGVHSW